MNDRVQMNETKCLEQNSPSIPRVECSHELWRGLRCEAHLPIQNLKDFRVLWVTVSVSELY